MDRKRQPATVALLGVIAAAVCGCPMQKRVKAAAGQVRLFYQSLQAGGNMDTAMGFYAAGFDAQAWRPILEHLKASLGDVKSWKVTGTDYQYRVATDEPQPGTKVEFTLDVTYDYGQVEEKVKFYLPTGQNVQWKIISHTIKRVDSDPQDARDLVRAAQIAAEVFFEIRRAGDIEAALKAYSPLFFSAVGQQRRDAGAASGLAPGADPIAEGRARWTADLERVRSAVGDVVSWEFKGEPVCRKHDPDKGEFFGDYVTFTLDVPCQKMPREEEITFAKVFGRAAKWLIVAHSIRPPRTGGEAGTGE